MSYKTKELKDLSLLVDGIDQNYLRRLVVSSSNLDTVTGCWVWGLTVDNRGYPRIKIHSIPYRVTRLSYRAFIGGDCDNMNVNHRCNNTLCVNPSHLYSGTQVENIYDMVRAGRHIRGERVKNSVITNKDIIPIFEEFVSGNTNYKAIAARYGLSRGDVIKMILRRELWKHVDVPSYLEEHAMCLVYEKEQHRKNRCQLRPSWHSPM